MSQAQQSIASLIIKRLMETPDETVIVTQERQMSANELVEAILSMAWRLNQNGLDQDSIIGLRTRYLFLALPSILALSLLGCRWIDCSSVLPTEESIETRLKRSGLKLSHRLEFGDLSYAWDPSTLLADPSWLKGIAASNYKQATKSSRRTHDNWMIAQSSGTTGTPKLMNIGNNEVASRLRHALPFSGVDKPVTAILFPPLSLVWTLYAIATLFRGGKLALFSKPIELTNLDVNFVTGSPFHFQALLNEKDWGDELLDTASITGGGMSKSLIHGLEKRFRHIVQRYGSSETGIVAYGALSRGAEDSCKIGPLLPEAEIKILDINTHEAIHSSKKGLVQVRSPWSISKYINNDLQNTFSQDRWFYTGDIGWLDAEKNLNIQGRIGDILNILGVKIDATYLDALLSKIAGVSDIAIFIQDSRHNTPRICVGFVQDESIGSSDIGESILSILSSNLNLNAHPYAVYRLEWMPRTSTGKINRPDLEAFSEKTQII